MRLSVRTDRRLLPAGPARRHLMLDIRAPLATAMPERPPLRLALVLDRSGSMAGAKLKLTLEAAARSLQALGPQDEFSVVLYNDVVSVMSPAVQATRAAVAEMVLALRGLNACGDTDLAAGWLSGCAQIGTRSGDDALVRCLLLTDGLANRGITDREELIRHAVELRRRGVTTSTLGVGEDFDEVLLHRLADAGGGRFYFAADESAIDASVAAETGNVLETVAREVVLHVRVPPGVRVESGNGDPCSAEDGGYRIELGSLRSGELCQRVVLLDFPAGTLGSEERVHLELSDSRAALGRPAEAVSWRRVSDAESKGEAADRDVELERARLNIALTRIKALDHQRRAEYQESYDLLCKLADELQVSKDARVLELARQLRQELASYVNPIGKLIMKQRLFSSYQSIKFPQPAVGLARGPSERPKIFLCAIEREVRSAVEDAYNTLVPHAQAWGIEAVFESHRPTRRTGTCLTAEEELDVVRSLNHAPHVTIAFMESAHQDNWFSHWHPNEGVALISLHDWSSISEIERSAFAAYEMILHGLRAASYEYEPTRFMHYETRGCLFDFCQQKQDVEIKLQAGHICPECMARLTEVHVDPSAVGRVWSSVQRLAHSKQPAPLGK